MYVEGIGFQTLSRKPNVLLAESSWGLELFVERFGHENGHGAVPVDNLHKYSECHSVFHSQNPTTYSNDPCSCPFPRP